MSTPTHTPLRHQALRKISNGQVQFVPGFRATRDGKYENCDYRDPLSGPERAILRRLVADGLASNRLQARPMAARPTSLTKVGQQCLAEWDATHPTKDGA